MKFLYHFFFCKTAGEIIRTILRLAEVKPNAERTAPVSFIDVILIENLCIHYKY